MLLNAVFSGDILTIVMSLTASLFLIFCVIPLHELAHAWVAYKMGDDTAKLRGQLRLNPLAYIDPVGAILIALIGFGWGRPTPVDVRNFKNRKLGIFLTALAGPLSNIILGGFLIFLDVLLGTSATLHGTILGTALSIFLSISAQISIYIAVLNLLPVPPFDGFGVISVFLSDRKYYSILSKQHIISMIVIVLLVSGLLARPLSILAGLIISGFRYIFKTAVLFFPAFL